MKVKILPAWEPCSCKYNKTQRKKFLKSNCQIIIITETHEDVFRRILEEKNKRNILNKNENYSSKFNDDEENISTDTITKYGYEKLYSIKEPFYSEQ